MNRHMIGAPGRARRCEFVDPVNFRRSGFRREFIDFLWPRTFRDDRKGKGDALEVWPMFNHDGRPATLGEAMSWCDRLTSTPAIGIFLEPHFGPSEDLLSAIAPILNAQLPENFRPGIAPPFNIAHQDSFRVDVQMDGGFLYSMEPSKISLTFHHKMKLKATSGGLPVAQLISQPLTYTKLLETAIDRLLKATVLLPHAKDRHVERIGVVSTTNVTEEDVPPGIRRFIDYIGKPWSGAKISYGVTMNAELRRSDQHVDRCIHNVKLNEDEERLVALSFDWQRLYSKPFIIEKNDLLKEAEMVKSLALAYFEELAVGEMFDGLSS